jgi:30S ribosomal protein S31
MGKGDIKSRKGKIARGSYGMTRPRKPGKSVAPKVDPEPTV